MNRASVCVAGSLMFDVVMRVGRRPERGETLLADECGTFLGGKGFNQAVAARRMGAEVAMIGRLGADEFGGRFRTALAAEGIDAEGVVDDPEIGTGIALPLIEKDGSNTIVVAPRANMRLAIADMERSAERIRASSVLLLQLETPTDVSEAGARLARQAGRLVVLNPAPALPAPDPLLRLAHVVTPNEVEASALTGTVVDTVESAFVAAERIRARGPETVIVTLGDQGAVVVSDGVRAHIPAYSVPVVDTTAAGDAFTGALAVALAEGANLIDAVRWGVAAGACAVTCLGAEPSLARRAEIAAVMAATTAARS